MGLKHRLLNLRSGSSDTAESKTTPTTTLCRASNDDYEITNQCMGEGNFAKVRLARRHRDGQVFAFKTFKRNAVDSTMVQAEFYIARGLRHKNIIATYELFTFGPFLGMLMEYAPTCLFDLVISSNLRPGDSERYLADLVSGVDHIHRLHFAHRDLKLENVVIGVDGYAKVIDFGAVGVAKPSLTTNTGSSAYMAPELFTHSMYDPILADIWSLGVIYACMALGKFPWTIARMHNAAFAAYSEADVKQPAPILCPQTDTGCRNPPDLVRQFPASVQSIVHSMLRVQPAKRSGLASISRSISDIASRQSELSNRTNRETDRLLQYGRVRHDYRSENECYMTKSVCRLSRETL